MLHSQYDYEYFLELSSQQDRIDKVFISSHRLHISVLKKATISWDLYSPFFDL